MRDIIKISKTLKLLYVEDDEETRVSTLEMLKNFFVDIYMAVDGEEALELFKKHSFDLIISDINMPKLTGIEMLKEIRNIDSEIPVLIFSAHNEVKYFIETIKLGVDGYILKPLEFSQFILVLKKSLEKIKFKKEVKKQYENLENEVQERTKELEKKLHYDSLTGLLNRYSFFEDIKNIDTPIVFIIDIDKFKIINEVYTTTIGSLVLKEFAEFLHDFIKGTTYKVYRLSSDEFIILDKVEEVSSKKYIYDIEHFFKAVENFKVKLIDDVIYIDVTIGCSILQHDAFESAKIALDFATKNNKRYAIYSNLIDTRKDEKSAFRWKQILKSAIKEDKVLPTYLPIVDKSSKILKYEAVLYIKNFCDELTLPSCFLDFIIESKYYDEISSIAIIKAFDALILSDTTISFNFSYRDIKNRLLLDKIEEYFKNNKNLENRVIFEIIEHKCNHKYDDVIKFIKRFREYNVKIAINNFGNTTSNFKYILEIQPDYLMIDGSLVESINLNEKSFALDRKSVV